MQESIRVYARKRFGNRGRASTEIREVYWQKIHQNPLEAD